MATQRLTVATIAGAAADAVESLLLSRRVVPRPDAVDAFCEGLRVHCADAALLYFSAWVDRWLMGDLVPGPGAVEGIRYQLTGMSPEEAVSRAARCGTQFDEQQWLAARLREAASANAALVERRLVLVVREPWGASALDVEVEAAARGVPDWLAALGEKYGKDLL
jgi:hypothetical protein